MTKRTDHRPPPEPRDPNRRRALTNVGGVIGTEGDQADAGRLARALAVPPATDADDEPARSHVHGFHTYPARMHPVTAARLVSAFVPPFGRVLDPFCGSGTVLVEALIAGRSAIGTDLNPLAVRLAACKTRPRTAAELVHLAERAADCATHADDRRKAKAGASRRFPREDVELFEPHVLLELDSIRAKIETLQDDPARADLELVLSAVLVKLSRKPGDTSSGTGPRRTAAGFAAKLFVQKTRDLCDRLAALGKLLPTPTQTVTVVQDDATELKHLPTGPTGTAAAVKPGIAGDRPRDSIAAIITSPPYAATYDYLAHHALRLRWLGLDAAPLARGEIGSRTAYSRLKPAAARAEWARELERFFRAAARVLAPGGPLVLMMADSAVGDVAIRADEVVSEVGRLCGLLPAARASQPRPHFHGPTAAAFRTRPRFEHALLLRKA
ncbi:DNA methyltransferase [Frigoriglobus tundricola]|uniref:site-specific DNA-methyltransferase (cytosine-N(4)-specific) n=1 Tax=Frigoriglobus tundricola TaxID=2774151 RepID=A0A6M5YG79_9BACT|nr:DNA methyltransferase [Frigoriglobus tundricola]QJW93015.1 DNA modification methylase [Frigoriglobus tundricola]